MQILLVDDNPLDRACVAELLRAAWPDALTTDIGNADELQAALQTECAALITAQAAHWADALTLLKTTRRVQPYLAVIALGETADWLAAVTLIKGGVDDYLPKTELMRLPQILRSCLAQLAAERREAEELQALRTSEERYRHITRLASDYAYLYRVGHDRSFHVEWVSDAFMKMTGYSSVAEVVAVGGWRELIHPDDLPQLLSYRERLLAGETVESDYRVMAKNGEVHWVHNIEEEIGGPTEEYLSRVAGASHEITAHKRSEAALRESRDRLQTLSRRLMDAQESERRRIARELHDETGQALTAVKLNLQRLKRFSDDPQVIERLDDSITIVEESLNSVRNISHELRPSILDDLGLVAALRWYGDRQSQRAGFTLHFSTRMLEERLPAEIETSCFRISQEAITNIIRHAAAQHVWIELRQTPSEFRMTVRDDGIGFNVRAARASATQGQSLGLLGMQERAQLAGGEFELKSGKKGGAELTVRFDHAVNETGNGSKP